jgi:hypothetical protein
MSERESEAVHKTAEWQRLWDRWRAALIEHHFLGKDLGLVHPRTIAAWDLVIARRHELERFRESQSPAPVNHVAVLAAE